MAAAAVVPFVTVDEYLHTVYEPDAEYVDGQIEERPLGELDHSELQSILTVIFANHSKEWGVKALPELRTQTGKTRFRVPDLLIIERNRSRHEQIVQTPPLLCIEILSPEDRWRRLEIRLRDFFTMGVPVVWVFDPEGRTVTVVRNDGSRQELSEGNLMLAGTPVSVSIAEVFAVLDEE